MIKVKCNICDSDAKLAIDKYAFEGVIRGLKWECSGCENETPCRQGGGRGRKAITLEPVSEMRLVDESI